MSLLIRSDRLRAMTSQQNYKIQKCLHWRCCSRLNYGCDLKRTDERRRVVQICVLDVTWLLQNGQFIPAFKSLIGRRLMGIIQQLLEATEEGRNYRLHVRETHQSGAQRLHNYNNITHSSFVFTSPAVTEDLKLIPWSNLSNSNLALRLLPARLSFCLPPVSRGDTEMCCILLKLALRMHLLQQGKYYTTYYVTSLCSQKYTLCSVYDSCILSFKSSETC